jgi:hypothetical protein
MSAFPDGVETRADAVRLLRYIDGQEELETNPWDIDDFTSVPKSDPVVERCRVRVRDELLDLLASRDPVEREKIAGVVANILDELNSNAPN